MILLPHAFFNAGEESKQLDKKKLAALVARKPETWRLLGLQTMLLPALMETSNLGRIRDTNHRTHIVVD